MRRTQADTALTRQNLLDAALQVFSRKGYAGTTLTDIAQAAKVTRGAIYHHFGSKTEVYQALVQERFDQVNQVQAHILAEGGTPLQILRRLMVRSLEYLEEDSAYRAVQELVLFKTAFVPELARDIQNKTQSMQVSLQQIEQLLKAARATGEIAAEVNPPEAALAILGLISGASTCWLLNPTAFSLKRRAAGIVNTLLNGLLPRR